MRQTVAIGRTTEPGYPRNAPFHPAERYPEALFPEVGSEPNAAYVAVRDVLRHLGLDTGAFGTSSWNPLGGLVRPGDHVVIKPNFIFHTNLRGKDYRPVVTHASVLRAVIDYVLIAQQGSGQISVLEAPNPNTEFERVIAAMEIDKLLRFYEDKRVPVEVRDLRTEQYHFGMHAITGETRLAGDPSGSARIDLGQSSDFTTLPGGYELLQATSHNRREAVASKGPDRGIYEVHKSYLKGDVIISLAKLKTHKKTGVTLALKNFIGLSARKNFMPHYRIGSPLDGGDEFPVEEVHPIVRRLKKLDWWMRDRLLQDLRSPRTYIATALVPVYLRRAIARRAARGSYRFSEIERGDWYGNDTLWRTVLDLNKILRYADTSGAMHSEPQRRYLAIVDGIVAGEGEGPLSPDPREEGVVFAGTDPVAVDVAITRWMGFDESRIPMLARALDVRRFPLTQMRSRADIDEIAIESAAYRGRLYGMPTVQPPFAPALGWIGHIEREDAPPPPSYWSQVPEQNTPGEEV